jgi:hypothetical protein
MDYRMLDRPNLVDQAINDNLLNLRLLLRAAALIRGCRVGHTRRLD